MKFWLVIDVITGGNLFLLFSRIIGVTATVLFFLSESLPLAFISLIVLIIGWVSGHMMLMFVESYAVRGRSVSDAYSVMPSGRFVVAAISTIASFILLIIGLIIFFSR